MSLENASVKRCQYLETGRCGLAVTLYTRIQATKSVVK
jgi:hypothetical protein